MAYIVRKIHWNALHQIYFQAIKFHENHFQPGTTLQKLITFPHTRFGWEGDTSSHSLQSTPLASQLSAIGNSTISPPTSANNWIEVRAVLSWTAIIFSTRFCYASLTWNHLKLDVLYHSPDIHQQSTIHQSFLHKGPLTSLGATDTGINAQLQNWKPRQHWKCCSISNHYIMLTDGWN